MKLIHLFEKPVKDKNELIKTLQSLGFDQIKTQNNEVSVLTHNHPQKRKEALTKIVKNIDNAKYNPSTKNSSVGQVDIVYDNNKYNYITAKPLNRQGDHSAGVANELFLANKISAFLSIANPLDIVFESPNKNIIVKNVSSLQIKGRQTSNKSKADLVLISPGKNFNISLKKDDAEYWESVDSNENAKNTVKNIIKRLVSEKKLHLFNMGSWYYIIPNFAFEPNNKEKIDLVFGNDILGKGAVITKTFDDNDFDWDESKHVLKIKVSHIIDSVKDIKGNNDVWFLVRNDKNRNTKNFYPGLRILACKPSRLNPNVMIVDYSGKVIRDVNPATVNKMIEKFNQLTKEI